MKELELPSVRRWQADGAGTGRGESEPMAQGFFDRSFPERYERDARVTAEERTVGDPAYPDLVAILGYWSSKLSGRFAPPRSAIDPGDFTDVLPRVKLVDVLAGPGGTLDFRFRLAGTAIGNILGTELTRLRPLDLQPPQFGAMVHEHYRQCVHERRPLLHKVEIDSVRRVHSYARLLLPLSSDGEQVDMLMTVDSQA
jgi:hypothetical protein